MNVVESNNAAKRCLAVCNEQIARIDEELAELGEKFFAGEITELLVKVRELSLRERRAQHEKTRQAMLGAIKHF